MTTNLFLLFPVAIGLPLMAPFIKFMIRLPLRPVFVYMNYFWDNYASWLRVYSTGWSGLFCGLAKYRENTSKNTS